MRVAHVEMIGGASGNMLLGALLDAGADVVALEAALRTIPVDGWTLVRDRVVKCGIAATHADFAIPAEAHEHDHGHSGHDHADGGHDRAHDQHGGHGRPLAEVLGILTRSGLSERQQARARAIYVRLGEAEARVHGGSVDDVHFHEVGAIDAILDVAATCVGFDLLGVERVTCGAFPIGRGPVAMTHGRYPNPPPATAELLRGAPTYDGGLAGEMVTPTGAAILTGLVAESGVRPAMRAERIGYGAGRSDFAIPNVLRVSIGPADATAAAPALAAGVTTDEIVVLEANVDDMSPQRFELALERMLAAGAADVWLAPVQMKKNRPAVLLGALAPPAAEAAVARAMLVETTTLGVRVRRERRYVLERETVEIATPLGAVRIKTAAVDGASRRTLEYDDLVRIARATGLPLASVVARVEESLPPL